MSRLSANWTIERQREATRDWSARNPDRNRERGLRYRSRHGSNVGRTLEQARAHCVVQRAVKAGRLVRPASCEGCGATPALTNSGRSRIQAHHEDYDKPLDVQWLCPSCHYERRKAK